MSESCDLSQTGQRDEVDLELINEMKQSYTTEHENIDHIKARDKDWTQRNRHGFTPVSFQFVPHSGISAGRTTAS